MKKDKEFLYVASGIAWRSHAPIRYLERSLLSPQTFHLSSIAHRSMCALSGHRVFARKSVRFGCLLTSKDIKQHFILPLEKTGVLRWELEFTGAG